MRREIVLSGTGWIGSGIVCFVVWALESGRTVCNCPALLPGTASSISNLCRCTGPNGLLYTGILVVVVGISLFLLNGRIERIIGRFEANARKRHGNRRG